MIYKNMEIHNVAEISPLPDGGGLQLFRVPQSVHKALSEQGKRMNVSTRSVELRFQLLQDSVKLKLRCDSAAHARTAQVYYGCIPANWEELDKEFFPHETELTIVKPKNLDLLHKIAENGNHPFSPEVVRILLPGGQNYLVDVEEEKIAPPAKELLPKKTYLSYGSSITHGYGYNCKVAANLKADLLNFGFSGSACLEPEMADYLSGLNFDFATVEMGVNILDMEPDEFQSRVAYYIQTFCTKKPNTPIFFIDVFYMREDLIESGKAEAFRKIVREEVQKSRYANAHYVNGLSVLDSAFGLSGDLVHPSPEGVSVMAENLTKIIQNVL